MRWLPLLVAAAFIAAAAAWLRADAPHRAEYGDGSSLAYGPGGASQARAYLAGPGGCAVTTLARPLARAGVPSEAVVLRLQPEFQPSLGMIESAEDLARAMRSGEDGGPLLDASESAWVEAGGRLVLAVADAQGGVRVDDVAGRTAGAEAGWRKTLPLLPGVRRIDAPARSLSGAALAGAAGVFAVGDGIGVARLTRGAGEVWLLSCPEAFSNARLGDADHLPLLLALVAGRRDVRFDEFAHGLADDLGMLELLRRWGLGPALALALAALIAWAWRTRRIIGRPDEAPPLPRPESVDGVAALGALYARALSRREAVEAHHRRLVREFQARLGTTPAAAQAAAERALGGWRPTSLRDPRAADSDAAIARINRAFRSLRDAHRRRRL